jgi:hypothetical protein
MPPHWANQSHLLRSEPARAWCTWLSMAGWPAAIALADAIKPSTQEAISAAAARPACAS